MAMGDYPLTDEQFGKYAFPQGPWSTENNFQKEYMNTFTNNLDNSTMVSEYTYLIEKEKEKIMRNETIEKLNMRNLFINFILSNKLSKLLNNSFCHNKLNFSIPKKYFFFINISGVSRPSYL